MTLEQRLAAFIEGVSTDVKNLITTRGNLGGLNTTSKNNIVAAINELQASISGAGATINDNAASTSSVYSSQKTVDLLASLKSEILGSDVDAAYDTLKELQTWIQANATAAANLVASVGNKVDFSQSQSLTTEQKTQARENIGAYGAAEIGDPDADLLSIYNAAKA